MTMKEGFFAKNIGTTTNKQHGLKVSKGNEIKILGKLALDTTATAANADAFIVPSGLKFFLTKMAIRPSTAVVDAGTTTGVIKVSYALAGTATLADSSLSTNVTTALLTSTTNTTTDVVLAAPLALPGGARVILRHVQGAGGSVAGVCDVTVYGVETEPGIET